MRHLPLKNTRNNISKPKIQLNPGPVSLIKPVKESLEEDESPKKLGSVSTTSSSPSIVGKSVVFEYLNKSQSLVSMQLILYENGFSMEYIFPWYCMCDYS